MPSIDVVEMPDSFTVSAYCVTKTGFMARYAVSSDAATLPALARLLAIVFRRTNWAAIDLPAMVVESHQVEEACAHALGAKVMSAVRPIDDPWQVLYELENEEAVRSLVPDIKAMAEAVAHCVIVTASAKKADFVSRMFAPHLGVDEDPVTGSAHCMLTPFWSARLGKTSLSALQCSARGGQLECSMAGDRVRLAGQAITFAAGTVIAPVF